MKSYRARNKNNISYMIIVLTMASLLLGCSNNTESSDDYQEETQTVEQPVEIQGDDSTEISEQIEIGEDTLVDEAQENEENLVAEILEQMTLEEKVYQLFFVTPEQLTGVGVVTAAGQTTKTSIERYPVGGIIYFSQNIESRDQTSEMLENIQSFSKIPLFTGIDEEGGTVSRVGCNPTMGTTDFPNMLTIGNSGDIDQAYKVGYTIGTECKELGFNLDFAPVADIYSNPENTVIGERAFCTESETVSEMVGACVRGFKDAEMLCTLKHFPGHGNTLTDSHYEAAVTDKTLEQLEEEEFSPFKSGIDSGADFVMVGHILTPNITDPSTPATLSKDMISYLRDDLQFDGVIITDAMNMAAITDYYSSSAAAVEAIQAGVDMILMPEDFHAAVSGIITALDTGKISEEMLDEHVSRILEAKVNSNLINEPTSGD